MNENQNGKKIEDRGENLLDIPNEYIKNEKSNNEPENILNIVGEKLKSRKLEISNRQIQCGNVLRRE